MTRLADALAGLDAQPTLQARQVASALQAVSSALELEGAEDPELRFEILAAELELYDEPYVWETHFGPFLTQETSNGRLERPALSAITATCITYWEKRMNEASHPLLRGRYADLVWDLTRKVTGGSPPIAAARTAIAGYVEAIADGRASTLDGFGDIQRRAIRLAASIDAALLTQALPRLTQSASSPIDVGERDRRQLELFDILSGITGARRPTAHLESLAAALRVRLEDLDRAAADKFTIADIALPLAFYYRAAQLLEDAQKVLRIWGNSVQRLAAATNSAMLASSWLREVHGLFPQFQMETEATALVGVIATASAGIDDELVRISHGIEIPQDELNPVIAEMVSGTKDQVIYRLAAQFIPNVDDARRAISELTRNSIFMNLTQTVVADEGRVAATIGPAAQDPDGHLIQQLGVINQFNGQIFRLAVQEAVRVQEITGDDIVQWLSDSLLFDTDRLELLKPAMSAYFANDWSTTIHLAVPQIENALRTMLRHTGQTLFRPHRNGTFILKNFDDVLHDPVTIRALPEDLRLYLQSILSDQRGLNIRNNVCHGLWGKDHFNWYTAGLVFHAVLALGALRSAA